MVTMGSGLGHLAQQQQQHSLKIDADLNKRRNKPIYRLLLLGEWGYKICSCLSFTVKK